MGMQGRWRIAGSFSDDVWLVSRFDGEVPASAEALDPDHAAWSVDAWFPEASSAEDAIDVLQRIGSEVFAVPLSSEPSLGELREMVRAALASGRLLALRVRTQLGARGVVAEEIEPAAERATAEEKTWIEIVLTTDERPPRPAAFRRYRIELPDGSTREGMLDSHGAARIAGIDPGTCQVTFPGLDAGDWP